MQSGGRILRAARRAARLSQRDLAWRAGTRQPAISAVERGEVAPSLERLEQLLALTGHRLQLGLAPRRSRLDQGLVLHNLELLPEERLELTIELSRFAVVTAGAAQRAWAQQLDQTTGG